MTAEDLRKEMEKITSSLADSGFNSIDSGIIERLRKSAVTADELNMKEGKRLIDNLAKTMKAIQEGKSTAESGNLRITALDFYLKKHSESELELIEDI